MFVYMPCRGSFPRLGGILSTHLLLKSPCDGHNFVLYPGQPRHNDSYSNSSFVNYIGGSHQQRECFMQSGDRGGQRLVEDSCYSC